MADEIGYVYETVKLAECAREMMKPTVYMELYCVCDPKM